MRSTLLALLTVALYSYAAETFALGYNYGGVGGIGATQSPLSIPTKVTIPMQKIVISNFAVGLGFDNLLYAWGSNS